MFKKKAAKKEEARQEDPSIQETIASLQRHLRVLGVASARVNDGTIFMASAEFLRKLADEAEKSPDRSALVFLKAVEL